LRAFASSQASRWIVLAVAGLAVAVAVGIAAAQLTSERIGLASEPMKSGEALAPKPAQQGGGNGEDGSGHGSDHETTSTSTTHPPAPTTTSTTQTSDDYGSGVDEESGDDD
jgi:hypothetical protein